MNWSAMRSTLRAHRVAGSALLAAVLLAAVLGPRLVLGPEVTVAVIEQRDLVRTVVASGRVETPHRVDIGTQIVGTVAQVPVAEGQSVAAAQPLIVLNDTELRAAFLQCSQERQTLNAECNITPHCNLLAAMDDCDMIPTLCRRLNHCVGFGIVFAQEAHRLLRKNHSKTKSISRRIAFVNRDRVRCSQLLHENGKVEAGRSATNDVNFQMASVHKTRGSSRLVLTA